MGQNGVIGGDSDEGVAVSIPVAGERREGKGEAVQPVVVRALHSHVARRWTERSLRVLKAHDLVAAVHGNARRDAVGVAPVLAQLPNEPQLERCGGVRHCEPLCRQTAGLVAVVRQRVIHHPILQHPPEVPRARKHPALDVVQLPVVRLLEVRGESAGPAAMTLTTSSLALPMSTPT